jgi:hypothetical protein
MEERRNNSFWIVIATALDLAAIGLFIFFTWFHKPSAPEEIKLNVPRDMFKTEAAWEANKQAIRDAYANGERPFNR